MTNFLIRDGRRSDAPALGRVTVEATREALGGRVPACWLTDLSVEATTRAWQARFAARGTLRDGQRLLVAVAEPVDEVLGLALLGETVPEALARPGLAEIFTHELLALHVDPLWQGHDVRRRLLMRAMGLAMRAGGTGMLVKALAGDRHRELYSALGAERVSAQAFECAGHKTRELLYGWHWPESFRGPWVGRGHHPGHHPGSAEASRMVVGDGDR